MAAVEHRQVIVVIAGGENLAALQAGEAREFGEGRAFAVILVAEAHVDRVAHELKPRHPRGLFLQKSADAIHLVVRLRGEADEPRALVDRVRPGVRSEIRLDVGEQSAGLVEKFVVRHETARVPVAKILPASVRAPVENLALRSQHVIRLDGEFQLLQTLLDVPEHAPGIDRPLHPARPHFRERGEKLRFHRRLRFVVHQRAVEIRAQQPDGRVAGCGRRRKRR